MARKERKVLFLGKEKINETLKELLAGIIIYGMICLLVGIPFVDSKFSYILGLVIGIMLAGFSASHLYYSIDKTLTLYAGNEGAATTYARKMGIIRYAVILVVFFAVCMTDFVYPLATFLGIMGLKIGAYLQPFIHKWFTRSIKNEK